MKTLIVFDSYFGNTEKIARAIWEGLDSKDVEMVRVADVKKEQLQGVELLIVGSPTRAFRPTKAIVSFITGIPKGGLSSIKVAAFDTRIFTAETKSKFLTMMVKLFGYAAKPISDRLEKKGGEVVAKPEGFFVNDVKGPLKEGELKRAENWVKEIKK